MKYVNIPRIVEPETSIISSQKFSWASGQMYFRRVSSTLTIVVRAIIGAEWWFGCFKGGWQQETGGWRKDGSWGRSGEEIGLLWVGVLFLKGLLVVSLKLPSALYS